jgi:hypothetical protein
MLIDEDIVTYLNPNIDEQVRQLMSLEAAA